MCVVRQVQEALCPRYRRHLTYLYRLSADSDHDGRLLFRRDQAESVRDDAGADFSQHRAHHQHERRRCAPSADRRGSRGGELSTLHIATHQGDVA